MSVCYAAYTLIKYCKRSCANNLFKVCESVPFLDSTGDSGRLHARSGQCNFHTRKRFISQRNGLEPSNMAGLFFCFGAWRKQRRVKTFYRKIIKRTKNNTHVNKTNFHMTNCLLVIHDSVLYQLLRVLYG